MSTRNKRILIIDDNHEIHKDFKGVLCPGKNEKPTQETDHKFIENRVEHQHFSQHFELCSAYQGEEGVQLAKEAGLKNRPFAVAFVDSRMPPGIDGIETIKQLWEVDPELQTVLCTAYTEFSIQQILDELGQCERLLILKKPFDLAEIYLLATTLTEKWNSNHEMTQTLNELERTHESLNEFTHFISRDLKTPLHSIQNHADYLCQVGQKTMSKPHLHMIGNVSLLSQRMESLLDSLIEYSRLCRYNFDVEEFDLVELITEAIDILELSGHSAVNGIELPQELPRIRCHRALVREALMHIIRNAFQYNDSKTKKVQVGWNIIDSEESVDASQPHEIEIFIKDNGRGIQKDKQGKVFEVFHQFKDDPHGENEETGAGIGLSMVKKIADLHNGEVRLESEENEGTTVFLSLGPHSFVKDSVEVPAPPPFPC